jgi:hypothetical protein
MDTKAFKRSLHQSENYHRRGFGLQNEVMEVLNTEYQSSLIGEIRNNNYELQRGDVTIRLAQSFGFCWGVERAVAMAYETRRHFPSEKIWITNEIIHNPSVNHRLREMEVYFIPIYSSSVIIPTSRLWTKSFWFTSTHKIVQIKNIKIVQCFFTIPSAKDIKKVSNFVT